MPRYRSKLFTQIFENQRFNSFYTEGSFQNYFKTKIAPRVNAGLFLLQL